MSHLRELSVGRGSTAPVGGGAFPKIYKVEPWDGKDGEVRKALSVKVLMLCKVQKQLGRVRTSSVKILFLKTIANDPGGLVAGFRSWENRQQVDCLTRTWHSCRAIRMQSESSVTCD